MQKISIDDIDSGSFDTEIHADRRSLSDPLNTSNVAITYYALEPGERFSGSVHTHLDQEEVFLIIEGTATFELRAPPRGADGRTGSEATRETSQREISVRENEAVRFAPGEFQSGKNDSDETVVAFALGAPRDSEDVRVSRIPALDNTDVACPDCDRDSMRISPNGGLICPDCGSKSKVEQNGR